MVERRERIPAEEITDPKNWNLPFWTEPASVVKAREKEEELDTVVEEQEIEIEPLTADQLEQIRQEAYNEGLQQGLVEGRQKGEKLGHDEGHKEGLAQGQETGRKLGFEAGSEQGKNQALSEGQKKTDDTVAQLKSALTNLEAQLTEQKQAIDELLPELVLMLSRAVVSQELDQGSEHIVALVTKALDALPIGTSQFTIEVHSLDLPFLQTAFEGSQLSGCLTKNDTVPAGGCQVLSEYSTVNFSQSERWQNVLAAYQRQLQLGLLQAESSEDDLAQPNPEQSQENEVDDKTAKLEPAQTNQAPIANAAPSANEAPSENEEPSAKETSTANETPAENKEPSAQQEPSANKEPTANKEPSAQQTPSTDTPPQTDVNASSMPPSDSKNE